MCIGLRYPKAIDEQTVIEISIESGELFFFLFLFFHLDDFTRNTAPSRNDN